MSRYPLPRKFDGNKPMQARTSFRFSGRDYRPGDAFPWMKMGVSHRKAKTLFNMGKITEAAVELETKVMEVVSGGPLAGPPDSVPEFDLELGVLDDPTDELDQITKMAALKEIAIAEGAPIRRSIKEQREAIRENRSNG